jgi:hypothetical protein
MEIFRDIIGYEGIYQISDLGTVKQKNCIKMENIHFFEKKILTNSLNDQGYLRVGLTRMVKSKQNKYMFSC